ncbi:NLR family CARD domain-containing protein 3-like [Trichomycterus rosablanca]|uniref:NLR family CARD domain-containing protein 3-like n=1 Tax=Trichomycterus rosablanca TaxID=2290929 RepID=UPI002F350CD6
MEIHHLDPALAPIVLQEVTARIPDGIIRKRSDSTSAENEVQKKLKLNLIKKFQCVNEVITKQGNPTLLNEIYTELYITEGESGKVNNKHEVKQIEAASKRAATEDTPIKCNNIFKHFSDQDEPIRTVLTKGVAGIGKTVSVQKFILDWAEGKENQDIHLIFPLPFRELNLMKDHKLSLMDLLHFYFQEIKETDISSLHKVLFIFDGLDECRLPLDLQNSVRLSDVNESASVHELLMNLIKGNLLPSALIWITSRPAAADQIRSECIDRVTEVRGFTDPQKEEYFRKRVSDQSLASRIISHLKSLRSLYIMCHIPVFCWIIATVLERMFGEAERGEIPKTMTQMYTHFIQTNIIRKKYMKNQEGEGEMILKLGKLAFEQLMKGNLIFYEEDLTQCGIDVREASVYSGVCTQIFREEFGLHQNKVYCFVHLSIQEHLAALYVHLTFMNENKIVIQQNLFSKMWIVLKNPISDLHMSAVDQALQSKNGHLDLFLRFLLGLSLKYNQNLLQALVTQTGSDSHSKQKTVRYIKKKISENPFTEKSINLFHCLNELDDHSLVQEIQQYLKSGKLNQTKLSDSQWSALVFRLLTSVEELDVFNLSDYTNKYSSLDEGLLKLMPVVAASRAARPISVQRSDSPAPSYISMKSDGSIDPPLQFKDKDPSSGHSQVVGSHCDHNSPKIRMNVLQEATTRIPEEIIRKSSDFIYAETEVQKKLKLNLIKKFQCVNEVNTKQRNPTLLNEIYTELYITEGESGKVNNEHEVRQIEAASRRAATEDTPIKCNNIFKPLSDQDKPIRTVLTKGVAGIGKTISVQKFILHWAEGKENQDVQLIFPIPFRELNLMKDHKLSLMNLLHFYFPEIKETNISSLYKVLFIFDGLDECRLPLDLQNSVRLSDVNESASVHELLMNLIKGNLLPSALIWITSRPAATDQIPSECIDRVTEVQGFNDPQKEEYFRKKVSDQSLASRIISHLKSLRSLYIMCHIPVFCWITATVLERMFGEAESGEIPKTLTQMYTHFLIIQTNVIRKKYIKNQEEEGEMILKLGKLAFKQLMKGNPIFYEEDLMECGIDVREASVYSGVCTQIFREESGLHQSKMYCFVHLSIQEHLAALYVHLTFMNEKKNVLQQSEFSKPKILKIKQILDLHMSAVDQALQSKNGHLDIFIRFLLGLSLKSNLNLLQALVTKTGSDSHNKEETVQYIKKKISENPSTEKSINLFHCLNELEDDSLVQEIQRYLNSRELQQTKLSDSQWSALVFFLLTSSEELDVFNLSDYTNKYSSSEKVFLKLMPVVAASRAARLGSCQLKDKSYEALSSVLSSESSSLRELDLSYNNLGDSGVKRLSAVLENPHCKLEILRLWHCGVSDEGCSALASALRSNPSHLRELNLSYNKLGDSGVKRLSAVLENLHCKLEILRLNNCGVSDEGCSALASALRSNPSHLRELHLSDNKLGDSGVKRLSAVLENPHCKLEILRLKYCGVSDEGCSALASALRSNPSHLRELNLSGNKLGDSGVKRLSAGLENPHCKLEILRLRDCGVSDEGCSALASALRSNPSHLRELDLSRNNLGESGVKHLSAVLENPHCKLEILRLYNCGVSDEGCSALASALRSNPSHLRELNLSGNNLGDSGVKRLCAVLENPHCKLEILRLDRCGVSNEGCSALASALRSNPSHLRELHLSEYNLTESGIKLLSDLKKDKHFRLEDLR